MKLPRDFYRQIISRNYCAVFSECVGERRHRALRQPAVADEFCIYSERRGDGKQEAQSRSALAAVEDAAVMQLVKTAEGCARVLGGAERFGIFLPASATAVISLCACDFDGGASRVPRSVLGVIMIFIAPSVKENICFRARPGLSYIGCTRRF